jgi:hypothetical protein
MRSLGTSDLDVTRGSCGYRTTDGQLKMGKLPAACAFDRYKIKKTPDSQACGEWP